MTSMNEPEVVTSLLEQIDKLTEEANRYRTALQDIYEIHVESHEDGIEMKRIAREALKEPIVKVNHDGQLNVFGKTTIEYTDGNGCFPFKVVEGE